MLFRKKIPRSCTYCKYAATIQDGQILCSKKGVILSDSGCRKFRYDPCKRVPVKQKAMDFSHYSQEDFKL